jgi:hypothetical protein
MPEKDPWKAYEFQSGDEDGGWIALGVEIIPLPASMCPDHVSDWTTPGLPKDPTPYNMPVFVIDQITTMKNGRRRVTIYKAFAPSIRATRDFIDIKDKWRPAPDPQPEEPEQPVILSRYQRKPVI